MSNKKRIQKLISKKYQVQKKITFSDAMGAVRKLEKQMRNIPCNSKIFYQKAQELRKARFKLRWMESRISRLFESDPMNNPIGYWVKKIQEIMIIYN